MAIVILGGLLTSTLMNLFVLPMLYLRFGGPDSRGPRGRGYDGPARQLPALSEREGERRARITVLRDQTSES
jgi:hypothetical protein